MKESSLTLVACSLITLVFGSIHAFSVFIVPLEDLLGTSRSKISLIYSCALVSLTIAVLFGHKIFTLLPSSKLLAVTCLLAASGTFIAGHSSSYEMVFLGYAVIFGGANGVGYGFVLQLSAQAMPDKKGLAMGTVTACYAIGAAVAPALFNYGLSKAGISSAMNLASLIFITTAVISYCILNYTAAEYQGEDSSNRAKEFPLRPQILLWLAYGCAVAAGLMIIGHATAILHAINGSVQQAILAVSLIALGNMSGGLIAGWLADRINLKILLTLLPMASALIAALLSITTSPQIFLFGLAIMGLCYGAVIAIYPVVVLAMFGTLASSRIYGKVFTAWGLAGLFAPWLAGYLFDLSGNYQLSLRIACLVSLLSVVVVTTMKFKQVD